MNIGRETFYKFGQRGFKNGAYFPLHQEYHKAAFE